MNRSYSELITLNTFEERFRYLMLGGKVGEETFGFHRWLNQKLYCSRAWLDFRDRIIIRDNGCDLGIAGHEVNKSILVHHINPITYDDVVQRRSCIFDSENVICTILSTHNAIHYGDEKLLWSLPAERREFDTCPWKKNERRI